MVALCNILYTGSPILELWSPPRLTPQSSYMGDTFFTQLQIHNIVFEIRPKGHLRHTYWTHVPLLG